MRKRLGMLLLLASILLTAGSGEATRMTGEAKVAQNIAPTPRAVPPSVERAAWPQPVAENALRRVVAPSPLSVRRPAALTDDDAAVVAEMSQLQLLAQGLNLDLSSRQWSALAAVTLEIQAIRQTYEAQIATGTAASAGCFRVEIPMYAAAGDAIRAKFLADLRAALGAATAGEIVEKLGGRLEGHFAGFGVAVQTLEIKGDPHAAPTDCEVTRTVTYWNSVEGGEQLTTRRETHFPAWEDPTGESWGALLAVVGIGSNSMSSGG
jgi:hypothetical protein